MRAQPDRFARSTAGRVATAILAVAFVLSVFHYADNWARFGRYALSPDSPVTAAWQIPLAWVIFTAAGAAGFVQLRRGSWWPAAVLVAFYSLSGLVGLAHCAYPAPGVLRTPRAHPAPSTTRRPATSTACRTC